MKMPLIKIYGIEQIALLGGKFIPLNVYIRKEEISKINHLSFYLNKRKLNTK